MFDSKDSILTEDPLIEIRKSILQQYGKFQEIENEQFVQFSTQNGIVFAEGSRKNGAPGGEWRHYSPLENRKNIDERTINKSSRGAQHPASKIVPAP